MQSRMTILPQISEKPSVGAVTDSEWQGDAIEIEVRIELEIAKSMR